MNISQLRRFIAAYKTEIVAAIYFAASAAQWVSDVITGATEQQQPTNKKSPRKTAASKKRL